MQSFLHGVVESDMKKYYADRIGVLAKKQAAYEEHLQYGSYDGQPIRLRRMKVEDMCDIDGGNLVTKKGHSIVGRAFYTHTLNNKGFMSYSMNNKEYARISNAFDEKHNQHVVTDGDMHHVVWDHKGTNGLVVTYYKHEPVIVTCCGEQMPCSKNEEL